MQKIINHRVAVVTRGFFILLLVFGFAFNYASINLTHTNFLDNGQSGLLGVIKNLKSFSQIDSSKDASNSMRAMVIALQSASGLLVTKQTQGEENEVIAVFFKLPYLFSHSNIASSSLLSVHLENSDWINNYLSILLTPPSPPPLFLC